MNKMREEGCIDIKKKVIWELEEIIYIMKALFSISRNDFFLYYFIHIYKNTVGNNLIYYSAIMTFFAKNYYSFFTDLFF